MHFNVVDDALIANAEGLPYVFDSCEVLGTTTVDAAFDDAASTQARPRRSGVRCRSTTRLSDSRRTENVLESREGEAGPKTSQRLPISRPPRAHPRSYCGEWSA
jgi:hypothetical protein